ncbi:MAG: hypothetical protein CL610_20255 [Anaerolineaceae bacterium]|nr:hypothetical protein [Anaerolineaceae bacterium]
MYSKKWFIPIFILSLPLLSSIFIYGNKLVAAQFNGGLAIITAENVNQLQRLEVVANLVSSGQIVYSPSGDYLAVGTESGVQIYAETLNSEFQLMETDAPVYSVTFSSDGLQLAGGDYEGNIYLWDMANHQAIGIFNAYENDVIVWKLAFFDNNDLLMSLGGSSVKVWDLASRTNITTIRNPEYPISAAIPDTFGSFIIIVDSNGSLHIFDSDSGKNQLSLQRNLGGFDLQLSPDQSILASAGVRQVTLLDWETSDLITKLEASSEAISDIAFNADGTLMATGDTKGKIRIWDVQNLTELINLANGDSEILSLAFSPDGLTLISNDIDGIVHVWGIPADD